MTTKKLPFTKKQIEEIIEKYPTPFHIYDERAIRQNVRSLIKAFSWAPYFKEYFAVKALPNPWILEILKAEGLGLDCSSLPELLIASAVGIRGENIMFTSNNTPAIEYKKAKALGAIINLDDITHIEYLKKHAGLPDLLCFRFNPGTLKKGNFIIGKPEEAKYGLTRDQLFIAYKRARDLGVNRFGLHTMVASNILTESYFIETANMLFDLVVELSKKLGIRFEFVNIGGGIGIPYRPGEKIVDMQKIGKGIRKLYSKKIIKNGLHPLGIFMENGRMITGPYGYLITKAIHKKDTYRHYIGVDATMANLMRPGMYGAYHHITVLGKEKNPKTHTYDITGSLCENNDKFAINRKLPKIDTGDILVIHDTGAHGHSMGFQYNGKLRSAELLLRGDSSVKLIRRKETASDYFATLQYKSLGKKS